nr:MAG TPA: hypothetical protein [Caudoviricetes sp.]
MEVGQCYSYTPVKKLQSDTELKSLPYGIGFAKRNYQLLKLDAIIGLATEISNILNQPGKPFTPQLNNTTLSVR